MHSHRSFASLRRGTLVSVQLLCLVAAPALLSGQEPKPPKGANAIVISTDAAPDAAYAGLAHVLVVRGYGLQTSDATLHVLTTTSRQVDGAGAVQVTAITTADSAGSVIELRGVWRWSAATSVLGSADDATWPIEYGGAGSSPKRKAWNELDAIARAFPGGRIEYRKQ
jgi:hypothetical protein